MLGAELQLRLPLQLDLRGAGGTLWPSLPPYAPFFWSCFFQTSLWAVSKREAQSCGPSDCTSQLLVSRRSLSSQEFQSPPHQTPQIPQACCLTCWSVCFLTHSLSPVLPLEALRDPVLYKVWPVELQACEATFREAGLGWRKTCWKENET